MPGEIEFLDAGDGPDGADEDQLVHGPRRWSRWAVGAGTLVLAGAVAAAVTTHDDGPSPDAASTRTHTPSAAAPSETPGPDGTPVRPGPESAFTTAVDLALPNGGGIQSVAVVGGDLAVLAPGFLARLSYHSGRLHVDVSSDVGLPLGDPNYVEWRLVTDGRDLWAVAAGFGGARVTRLDPATMQRDDSRSTGSPAQIVDAGALDGHLYLNTKAGVYDLAASAHAVGKRPMTTGGAAMAVDPARHELLLLGADGSSIRAYSLTERKTVARASLPFRGQSLTVVDGAVWVAGVSDDAALRPVTARLDPTTLTVIGHSSIRSQRPGEPALIAGTVDLWVQNQDLLWCVDAETGAIAQQWARVYGAIAPRASGQVFVGGGSVVGRLRLDDACAG